MRPPRGPRRRLPVGAEPVAAGATHFRVWAPRRRRVEVVLEDERGRECGAAPLAAEPGGYFSGTAAAGAGARYRFRLDGGERYPDPASRFQPDGPHGPSEVIDPAAFRWGDAGWAGVPAERRVVYELHVGTFTAEGSWAAAAERLGDLARLGVTVLEVMPVADFPGRFGWGYDGVNLFAPTRLYGRPDDFRRFVDRAHAAGLGVILDVVYNHLGPDGNYLAQFADSYFTDRYTNEWGEAINFDGPDAGPVRELFVANAGYWVDEFHLDGLRLDATQQMFDASPRHVVAEIGERVRAAAPGRATFVVAENEKQEARLARPAAGGGLGLDALWNDDWHHSAVVALTARREAYYTDYRGDSRELVSAAKYGFLFQGQRYEWQRQRRGSPALDLAPSCFVHFLENHDQVANSARGDRLHRLTSPGRLRALTALLLLGPQTPMLFQGQEFACSAPFLYFADHGPDLAALVRRGRADFLAQFPSIALPPLRDALADPADPETFARCKLDHGERERHATAYALHRDLLALRRDDPVFRAAAAAGRGARALDGVALGASALVLRWFAPDGGDRLLALNLGRPLDLGPASEPLLAPPAGRRWAPLWSSEDPRYGGLGAPHLESEEGRWRLPGESAAVLAAEPDSPRDALRDALRDAAR